MQREAFEERLYEQTFENDLLLVMFLGAMAAALGMFFVLRFRRYLRHRAARRRWMKRMQARHAGSRRHSGRPDIGPMNARRR